MMTLLRMARAALLLLLVLIGVAMDTAHRRAEASHERIANACSRYVERRSATAMGTEHPMVRRLDPFCGFGREP